MQSVPHPSDAYRGTSSMEWYAAYVKHQHERKAAALLERKGIEVFLPLQKSVRRWKDRNKSLVTPIFPGYLFLQCVLKDKLSVVETPGIFFLVESGGRACPIPKHEIDSLRRAVEEGNHAQPHPYLASGDRVRICSGPLSGLTGILIRFKNHYRVVLGVELLYKAVSIEVDTDNLEHIGSACTGTEISLRKSASVSI